MNNKQKLVYLSLIAITIIGILSGASYAYFQVQQKQGEETVIESGTMALTLEDGATITADNLIPGEYIEKEFTVRNTGTLKTGYDIYLSEVVNTFVNQNDLVYEIISSNGYNTSNQVQVPNTETKIINNYNINPLEEHKYILKITYKLTNENQNDNMGRGFTAKININEYNQNNSERYIKLYDANNNEIDKQVLTNNSDYYYPLSNINLSNSTNIYCDNGGIPTIENNTLKVSEVTTATDCKVSNSINTTITNLPNTKTGIVMTNNQDNVAAMTIASGKEVVLDLNGKEIKSIGVNETSTAYNSNHKVFTSYGLFTINDKDNMGGIFTGITARPILVSGGITTVNGGNYNGRQSFVNAGGSNASLIINDGIFKSLMYEIINIENVGDNNRVTINGGIFNNTDSSNNSVLGIGNSSPSSIININGGRYYSNNRVIYNNNGTVNINGGYFESKSDYTIYNKGTMNITGEQVILDENDNYVSGVYVTNKPTAINKLLYNIGTMTINNGTFISHSGRAINNTMGNLTINNGFFKSIGNSSNNQWSNACLVQEQGGITNINNGYFESLMGFGILSSGEGAIVNLKNAIVKSYDYFALQNQENGVSNICKINLLNNKYLRNAAGYIYYHTNAFGNVTPIFDGTTANIQVKDSVCD